jgi:hypothetical protein
MKVVFVGPSFPDHATYAAKDITFLPPAHCGDVHFAAQNGATHIGLIDGTFESGMSVWHKEIVYALEKGVVVAGASSMGALRAAECAAFGMKGFGVIFAEYDSGVRTRDADVALVFAPQELGYQPLSITMADLEATLAGLVRAGRIKVSTASRVTTAARSIFYKRRTLETVVELAVGTADEELRDLLSSNWIDQKQTDAISLLSWLGQCR